jgi:hypothetical protein
MRTPHTHARSEPRLAPETPPIRAIQAPKAPIPKAANPNRDENNTATTVNQTGRCFREAPQLGQMAGRGSGRGKRQLGQNSWSGPGAGIGAMRKPISVQ